MKVTRSFELYVGETDQLLLKAFIAFSSFYTCRIKVHQEWAHDLYMPSGALGLEWKELQRRPSSKSGHTAINHRAKAVSYTTKF
jgi:hypothetical protein